MGKILYCDTAVNTLIPCHPKGLCTSALQAEFFPTPTSTSMGTSIFTACFINSCTGGFTMASSSLCRSKMSLIVNLHDHPALQFFFLKPAVYVHHRDLDDNGQRCLRMGALMALRPAKPRVVIFLELISLKYRLRPRMVSTYSFPSRS